MKFHKLAIALICVSLPFASAFADDSPTQFTSADFSHATEVHKGKDSLIHLDLSKEGKEKVKKLNLEKPGKNVGLAIQQEGREFKFRGPITGDSLEMGPVSHQEAEGIVSSINQK